MASRVAAMQRRAAAKNAAAADTVADAGKTAPVHAQRRRPGRGRPETAARHSQHPMMWSGRRWRRCRAVERNPEENMTATMMVAPEERRWR